MTFAITTSSGNMFFSGFSEDGVVLWTADKAGAWVGDDLTARAQASLLIRQGYLAQRKVVGA